MNGETDSITAEPFDPEAPYRQFAWTILRKRVRSLRKRLRRLDEGGSAESVHRTRVASRRLRTALRIFADALPGRKLKSWQGPVRKLARRLGVARDTDVQLELIEGVLAAELPRRARPGLGRLHLRLTQRRSKQSGRISKAVARLESEGTLFEIERFLKRKLARMEAEAQAPEIDAAEEPAVAAGAIAEAPQEHPPVLPERPTPELPEVPPEAPSEVPPESVPDAPARVPVDAARALIASRGGPILLARLDEMLAFGPIVHQPHEIERLHEMRIAAKHLRYALEMFSPALGPAVRPATEAASHIQTLLGEIHDDDVWHDQLPEFLEKETKRTIHHLGRGRAMGRIRPGIELLRQRQAEHRTQRYQEFVAFWDDKMQRGLWGELRTLLEAAAGTQPTVPVER